MEVNKLKWCFRLREGLKIMQPNERLSKVYLKEAKSSLKRAEKNFKDKDLLWTTVVIYYADYYSLYSFLQRIGVKCENHSCSILAVEFILGKERINIINEHKTRRIDAQYYMRIDKEKQVNKMLQESKNFVAMFDEIISNMDKNHLKEYRTKLKKVLEN